MALSWVFGVLMILADGRNGVQVDPAVACLPARTVVGSEGCCIKPTTTATAAKTNNASASSSFESFPSSLPPEVVECSKEVTLYGHCARSIQYPKPNPPHYHIADPTCETNDPNAPFYDALHGVYHLFWQKHCATPVPKETIKGIVYGHAVSRDLVKWAMMPVAIWNDENYDRYAIYSGSATVTPDGVPHIIYPGLCLRDEWPADHRARYCVNFVEAVPTNHAKDTLLQNWSKPGHNPIVNGSSKDPSAAWQHNGSDGNDEWRFMDNTGNIFVTANASFGPWKPVGKSQPPFPGGDCPSLFPLPKHTPGMIATESKSDTRNTSASPPPPTHVHIRSGVPFGTWMQVGSYVAGAPFTAGSWTTISTIPASACTVVPSPAPKEEPTAAAAAAPPLKEEPTAAAEVTICGMNADVGQMYAGKDFYDPVKGRRLLWGWAAIQPNSTMTMLREITWNPVLEQLEYVHTRTHTRTHTHARTYTRKHTHTHTHTRRPK